MIDTNDFNKWLDSVFLDDWQEVYGLYRAVDSISKETDFECSQPDSNEEYYIVTPTGDKNHILKLVSQKAREAFLKLIETEYMKTDAEIYYGLNKNKESDNS